MDRGLGVKTQRLGPGTFIGKASIVVQTDKRHVYCTDVCSRAGHNQLAAGMQQRFPGKFNTKFCRKISAPEHNGANAGRCRDTIGGPQSPYRFN